jgi:hypothetical protein
MSERQERFSRKEAAAYLRTLGYPLVAGTLARMAARGKGPPYRRYGHRTVTYARADLESWAASMMVEVKGDLG